MIFNPSAPLSTTNPLPVQIVSAPEVTTTWANRPAPSSMQEGSIIFVTDIGGGNYFRNNGAAWRPVAGSVSLGYFHGGDPIPADTDWHTVATMTVPGGLLQAGDSIYFDSLRIQRTQSANRVNLRMNIGGQSAMETFSTSSLGTYSVAAGIVYPFSVVTQNTQIGGPLLATVPNYGVNNMSVDLTQNQTLTIDLQKTVAGELAQLVDVRILMFRF